MKNILYTIIFIFLFSFSVFADFQAGKDAYVRGDFQTALKNWKPLAEQGNIEAQINLGVMYYKGVGVTQDNKEAVKWYRLAAEQGYARAQHNLGFMYDKGKGVTQDNKEAVKWYRLAAEQGYARAQHNLGFMYDKGKGVTQDYKEAMKWYRLAAELGLASAQHNLGVMYDDGRGVTQDYKEAMKWLRLAAEQGHVQAQNNLGAMYFLGDVVKKDLIIAHMWFNIAASSGFEEAKKARDAAENIMTPEQIAKAQELALEQMGRDAYNAGDFQTALKNWKPLAEQGNVRAQINLYIMYSSGEGVTQDDKEATRWLRLAVEQEDAEAQYELGSGYELGVGGHTQEYKEAMKWYRLAAEQGYVFAQYRLASMYNKGKGVIKDYVIAYMWYNVGDITRGTDLSADRGWKKKLVKKMTPEQIAKAQELAHECIKNNYKDCEQLNIFQKLKNFLMNVLKIITRTAVNS